MAVMKGARMAIDECQRQFKNRRWNCPTMDNGHGGSIFGKILEKGKIRVVLTLNFLVPRKNRI